MKRVIELSIFSLFLLATITDYLDGFFARYMKQVTSFGEFLDPVADKLLVIITSNTSYYRKSRYLFSCTGFNYHY